jgi:hypothetical protein
MATFSELFGGLLLDFMRPGHSPRHFPPSTGSGAPSVPADSPEPTPGTPGAFSHPVASNGSGALSPAGGASTSPRGSDTGHFAMPPTPLRDWFQVAAVLVGLGLVLGLGLALAGAVLRFLGVC